MPQRKDEGIGILCNGSTHIDRRVKLGLVYLFTSQNESKYASVSGIIASGFLH